MEGQHQPMRSGLNRRDFLKRSGLAVVGTTAAASILAACASEESGGSGGGGGGGGGTSEPFKLGALIPLTGIETHIGLSMQICTQAAVDEINAAGGVLGRQIELIIEDEASDPAVAVQKAQKLINEDGCTFLVGTLLSSVRNAVVEFTRPAGVPLFNPTYYEGGLCGPDFLSTGALPNQQIDPFVPWLVENKGQTFYLIGSDYAWPRGSFDAVKRGLEAAGGTVVGEEYVGFGGTDYSAEIGRILDANPDVLYPLIAGVDGITFWKQLADFDFQGTRATHSCSEAIAVALPDETANGIISASPYFMVVDNPANSTFLEKYLAAAPAEFQYVDTFGEGMYDAVHLFAIGAEQAGSLDHDALMEGLKGATYDAPQGTITIDPTTLHTSHAFHIAEIKGSNWQDFELVYSEPNIQPAADCGVPA